MYNLKEKYYQKTDFSEEKLNQICSYISELYPIKETDAFLQVRNLKNGHYYNYTIDFLTSPDTLREALSYFEEQDLLLSMSALKSVISTNKASDIFATSIICVDVDFKKTEYQGHSVEQIVLLLKNEYFGTLIPEPNIIEKGNQLRLIYKIEPCYIPKKSKQLLKLINRVSDHFAELLHDLGAEAQHSEKFIRLPYSINSKNGAEISIERLINEPYELSYFVDEFMPEKIKITPKKKKSSQIVERNGQSVLHNLYTLNSYRLEDFKKIQASLNEQNIDDRKKTLCYLYRNYCLILGQTEQEAITSMLEFNQGFLKPLSNEKRLISNTNNLTRKQYFYKNKTLAELLDLTDQEMKKLELKSITKPTTKKERNDMRPKSNVKQESLEKTYTYIKKMKSENYKNKEIADFLNIPLKTLERHITHLRKLGDL